MRRVNVLFLMPQMGMGGSERLVHSLVSRLDRRRFKPSVAWLHGENALPEFRELQVPLYYVPKRKRVDVGTMRTLARVVESEDIDVVNAQHFMPTVYAYYGCRIVAGRALIFTAHSQWEVEDTRLKWRLAGGYLLRRIAMSVGVTSETSKALQEVFRIKESQILTIENGVDTDLFKQGKDVQGLRKRLGLSTEDLVIGIVANLKRVKNHVFLLQAFLQVAHQNPHVKLMIVGQGFPDDPDNTEDELRLFVRRYDLLERVLFLGYRSDIPELLQLMDVFCLMSLKEGLPISLLEAMASGVPVVGTNVEGNRSVIDDRKNGILVENGDVRGLARILVELLNDGELRARLGRAARLKALQKYSLCRCVQAYEELFFSAAHSRGRAGLWRS